MSSDSPKLVVIAGPNGAGKSTMVERFQRSNPMLFPKNLAVLNPDHVSLALCGGHIDTIDQPIVDIARHAAEQSIKHWIASGRSVAFETNFSHPSKIDMMRAAKQSGYQVVLLYVGLSSSELAESRVKQRVREGGHDVPRDRIAKRYHGGLERLAEAIPVADLTVVYDNSLSIPEISAGTAEVFRFSDPHKVTFRQRPPPTYLRAWLERHFPGIPVE